MRSLTLLTAAAVAAATLTAFPANATTNASARTLSATLARQVSSIRRGIGWHRSMTWHYQTEAGLARTPTEHAEMHTHSVAYLHWIEKLWARRHHAAERRARSRPARPAVAHLALWLCIHRGEGAWNDDTGNGYYGGLQMTAGWYGGVGHLASSDPPSVQMAAAEAQYRASGYSRSWLEGQWPNTSPPCLGFA